MAIFLPLLFAEGRPTSLEKITQEQLEKFIPFMLSCCPGQVTGVQPKWWPRSVPYQFPLCAMGKAPLIRSLKELVCRCYEYHNCGHVLRFCARLAEVSEDCLSYMEMPEGYVSIYGKNNKLIVRFKKKNQTYDKYIASPHKSLLPRKPQPPNPNQVIEDIYLCNFCDEEFTSGKDAVAHEVLCKGKAAEERVQNACVFDQDSVMRYFGLARTSDAKKSETSAKRGTSHRLTSRSYSSIPISSPLGCKMASNITTMLCGEKRECNERIERHCRESLSERFMPENSLQSKTRRPRRMGVFSSYVRSKKFVWTHTYCFNKKQREDRKLTLQTGLNKRSRSLLKHCKTTIVLLEKLPLLDPLALHAAARLHHVYDSVEVAETNSLSSSEHFVIDLCSSDDEGTEDRHISGRSLKHSVNQEYVQDENAMPYHINNNVKDVSSQHSNSRNRYMPKNVQIKSMQDADSIAGPQYAVSPKSTSIPFQLMSALSQEDAQVPSPSTVKNWLSTSSNSSCSCGSVVCVCVSSSNQAMVPLRPILT